MRSFARGIPHPRFRGLVMLSLLTILATMGWRAAHAALPRQTLTPTIHLPSMLNAYCGGTRPASNPIGLQVYGPTDYDHPSFKLLQATQSSWVRNHIDWFAVEPVNLLPSEYKWSRADRSLAAANDHCMNMVVTIDGTPRWAATSHIHSPYRPEMEAEFVELVGAIVERYDGDGHDDAPGSPVANYWEFYNEPDVGGSAAGDGWGVYPAAYAKMLEAVYPVIKAANPEAQVVFGGISYDNFTEDGGIFVRDFLDKVLAAGGGDYFDIMNVHYYPFHDHRTTWTESKSSGLREKIEHIHTQLAKHKLTKPLMITEVGWHSSGSTRSPSTNEFQSRYIVQLLTQAKATQAEVIIWWSFIDARDYPFKSGVATSEYAKKPSYPVYVEAVHRIGAASDLRLLVEPTAEDDLEVYASLEAGTEKLQYIAWLNPIAPFNAEAVATFNDQLTERWQAPGLSARVIGKTGALKRTVLDEDDGEADGLLTFTISTDPIYIVVDEPAPDEDMNEEENSDEESDDETEE